MILEFQTAAQAVKAGADLLRGVMTAEKALSEAEWKLKLADAISLLADARMAIVDAGEKSADQGLRTRSKPRNSWFAITASTSTLARMVDQRAKHTVLIAWRLMRCRCISFVRST